MNGEVKFNQEQLQEALNHAVDVMDRVACPFLLMGETARSIVEDGLIKGEGIYLGARKADVTEGVESMMRTLGSNVDLHLGIDGLKKDEKGYTWIYKGIPIEIKVIHRKYGFINNPDSVWYWGEEYRIPNPFEKYYKARGIVQ